MNLFEFTERLNNNEYHSEVSDEDRDLAYDLGFVIVYGASDDIFMLDGAMEGEAYCFNGGRLFIDKDGIFEECECKCKYSSLAKDECRIIDSIWGEGDFAWTYKTDIPHETFNILEDGDLYCQGIVFDIKDL